MTALIKCSGIAKRYGASRKTHRRRSVRVYLEDLLTLSRSWREGSADEHWVLRGVDLEIRRGQAVGILGKNGAGKSTLLRIISNRTVPDAGICETVGDVAILSNLTAGFQSELSGRENISLYAALRGRPANEAREHEAEIIDFSELGEKIDAPFYSYSQGMKLRLGFSITCCMSPDIIIIDETLGVGDREFRKKCLGKLREMRDRTAILLASHNAGTIRSFCDSAIVLDSGRVAFSGAPSAALSFFNKLEKPKTPAKLTGATEAAARAPAPSSDGLMSRFEVTARAEAFSDGKTKNEALVVSATMIPAKPIKEISAELLIYDADGKPLSAVKPKYVLNNLAEELYTLSARIDDHRLVPGEYFVAVKLTGEMGEVSRSDRMRFTIGNSASNKGWGKTKMQCEWDPETDEN